MFCYLTMSATTVTFLLVWEHSHYVLFIQGLCLFLLDSFDLVPPRKVKSSISVEVINLPGSTPQASGRHLTKKYFHTNFYILFFVEINRQIITC